MIQIYQMLLVEMQGDWIKSVSFLLAMECFIRIVLTEYSKCENIDSLCRSWIYKVKIPGL